jgi:hypothetical protein
LAFGLQGDVSMGELDGLAGLEEGPGRDDGSFWIELGFLVAEDFLPVDAVDDLFVASHFDFDFDPLIGGEVGCGGLDDVLGPGVQTLPVGRFPFPSSARNWNSRLTGKP